MNIYSTVCNILPSRATEQRERETSIEDCSFFMCLSQYLSFLKVINWVRLSQAFSSISPVKLANEKRTNGSSVDWCETQCCEQECVCVCIYVRDWVRVTEFQRGHCSCGDLWFTFGSVAESLSNMLTHTGCCPWLSLTLLITDNHYYVVSNQNTYFHKQFLAVSWSAYSHEMK